MAWRQWLPLDLPASSAEQTIDADPPWRPSDTLIGVLLTLVPLVGLSLISQSTPATAAATPPDAVNAFSILISTAILEGIFLIAPLYYAHRAGGQAWLQSLGIRKLNAGLAIGLFLLAAMATVIADYAYDGIVSAFHLSVQTNADHLEHQLRHMPLTLDATLLGAVLIAPICEELFFRGFLLQGLRAVMSTPWAVVVSSLIFAAAHADLGSFPLLLVLGLLMGTLRVLTRSIWPGVALHTFNNLLTAFFLLTTLH